MAKAARTAKIADILFFMIFPSDAATFCRMNFQVKNQRAAKIFTPDVL